MVGVMLPQIILTYSSKSDLTSKVVSNLFTTSGMTNSTLNSFHIPQADALANFGIIMIFAYFLMLFIFHRLRHMKIHRKRHHSAQS
jgi:hypothetical protein